MGLREDAFSLVLAPNEPPSALHAGSKRPIYDAPLIYGKGPPLEVTLRRSGGTLFAALPPLEEVALFSGLEGMKLFAVASTTYGSSTITIEEL